jgi:hypothetical protein
MKSKHLIPILVLLASLLLAACLPFLEDDCYEEHSEEYCDSEYDDEHNAENDAEADAYAEEDGYDEYQAEQEEELRASAPTLSIESIPEFADPAFEVFSQYIDVFGLGVYASSDVPEAKIVHAAGIMAQYLDNDEDGIVDNPDVLRALQKKQASIFIFPRPDSREEKDFFDEIVDLLDSGKLALQPLYGEEIIPNGAAIGEFDASLEEIFHLITSSGYASVYPDIFGENPDTEIAKAMDVARGGFFEYMPETYPAEAWFTYDDETCDYTCMIAEYHYWSLTSLLGAQNFSGRGEQIEHEWRLNTPEKLKNGDPAIYALLTDPQYHFPSTLPNGKYRP